MFHLPTADVSNLLKNIALSNAENDIQDLEEQLNFCAEQQENLNGFLGAMPVLADIVDNWMDTDYYGNELGLVSATQMAHMVDKLTGLKLTLTEELQMRSFLEDLHLTLSGTTAIRPYASRGHDLYDMAYLPFCMSFVKHVLKLC